MLPNEIQDLKRAALTLVILLAIPVALAVVLRSSLQPSYGHRPLPLCLHRVRNIEFALACYHEVYDCFPPAFVADKRGQPWHSWRVLILPYLGEQELYASYQFDEPWNGPRNRQLHDRVLDVFCCPYDSGVGKSTQTSFVAVVGKETAWPGEATVRLRDFKDGTTGTVHLVEIANSGIHWMEPRDLYFDQIDEPINSPTGNGISSRHPDGSATVSFVDGTVRIVDKNCSVTTLRALLTITGDDGNDLDEF